MSQFTLEEHLSDVCPNCGKEHEGDFKIQFENLLVYQTKDCNNCGYHIHIKKTIQTCGTIKL